MFLQISGYLLLIGMSFIGLSYILVYIGAVSILFLFTLMLINIRISELHTNNRNSLTLGLIVSISFYLPVFSTLINTTSTSYNSVFNSQDVFISSSNKWDGNLAPVTEISSMGNILYTSHSMWLMVISIILLLSMVGTIIVTVPPQTNPNFLNIEIKNSGNLNNVSNQKRAYSTTSNIDKQIPVVISYQRNNLIAQRRS